MCTYMASFIGIFSHILIVSSLAELVERDSDQEQRESEQDVQNLLGHLVAGVVPQPSSSLHNAITPPEFHLDDTMMYTSSVDLNDICLKLWRRGGTKDVNYTTKKVECDQRDPQKRAAYVTCASTIITQSISQTQEEHPGIDIVLHYKCALHTVCQPIFLLGDQEGAKQDGIGCAGEHDVNSDIVTTPVFGDPHISDEYVHCGVPLTLPGLHYSAPVGQNTIDIVLTEQVRFLNGSIYSAPALYIREKGGLFKDFDRVYRRDVSVASAEVELGIYRGMWQTRQFEFCMRVEPTIVATPLVFMYSFLHVPRRR